MAVKGGEISQATLDKNGFRLDGSEVPLVSAQFEAFRNDPADWPRALAAIKNAGIDIVSTCIAWDFHEVQREEYDFGGRTSPTRDLQRLLELCSEFELLIFARPGPFIDAEWETRGPPKDVMELDRLHPEFLTRAHEWIEAISGVLAPAQIMNGGPVAALQVDNQNVYPWVTSPELHRMDGDVRLPYDREYHDRMFRDWTREHWGTLESLNRELGMAVSNWDEIAAPDYADAPFGLIHASFDFVNYHVSKYLDICARAYRNGGMKVPFYSNYFQFLGYVKWDEIASQVGSVGMDFFMPRGMPRDQAFVANWWYRLHSAQLDYSWAADIQAGWIGLFEQFGFQTPAHAEYVPMAAQAAGFRGLNFFMFVERDDWSNSPVDAHGVSRPERYERYKKVVRSYRGISQVDEHLRDVGLLWNRVDHETTYLDTDADWSTICRHNDIFDEPKEPPTWWATFKQLVESDVDFDLWIPGVSPGPPPRILVHAGLSICTAQFGRHLHEIARRGGYHLLEVTPLPVRGPSGKRNSELTSWMEATRELTSASHVGVAELPVRIDELGARSYSRSRHPRVWTYVYRDRDGAIILGAWNAGTEHYNDAIDLDHSLFPDSLSECTVFEPRIGDRRVEPIGHLLEFDISLEPCSARVFRIDTGD